MAKLLNIDALVDADIIHDGTDPTLKISNASGAALEVNKFVASSSATLSGADLSDLSKVEVNQPILAASATITGLTVRGASVASGPVMSFTADSLTSCTTILFTTGGVAGTKAIRITQADGTFAWIPVLPDAAVTGAVI